MSLKLFLQCQISVEITQLPLINFQQCLSSRKGQKMPIIIQICVWYFMKLVDFKMDLIGGLLNLEITF